MLRAVAARGNYFGQERVAMQFAAKETSRFSSKPEEQNWRSAKRLARHLKECRRVAIERKFHKTPEKFVVWSDTHLAGRKRVRAGVVVMFGNHFIKMHSLTQETVPLSSGESELYGIVKVATMKVSWKIWE